MIESIKQMAESKLLLVSSSVTSIGGGGAVVVSKSSAVKENELIQDAISLCSQYTPTALEEWAYIAPLGGLAFLGIQTVSNIYFKAVAERRNSKKSDQ